MLITVRIEDVQPGDRLQGLRGGERIATTIKKGYKNAEVIDQNGKSSIYEPLGTEVQVDRDAAKEMSLEELDALLDAVEDDEPAEVPQHVIDGQVVVGRVLHAKWNTSRKLGHSDQAKQYQALIEYIDAHPHLQGTKVDPR